jgi:hypothetical protein
MLGFLVLFSLFASVKNGCREYTSSNVDKTGGTRCLPPFFRQVLATLFPKISFVHTSEIWHTINHAPHVANSLVSACIRRNKHGTAIR